MKRSNLEAIRRADAEAEKDLKRTKVLEERRAPKRASATPMDELEESATNAEVTAESLMIAAEAVLTETRETFVPLRVSALRQAHETSHRPETTARGVRGRVACWNTRHVQPLGGHDENSDNVEIQVHCERL